MAEQIAKSAGTHLIICPYCGHTQVRGERCDACRGLFEPLSKEATQIAMGPWFIRDTEHPFKPGCSYQTLVRQVQIGKVRPETIIRGPSTHQFWALARTVPGIAHWLGYCHNCGHVVRPGADRCPDCETTFEAVKERNELGLMFATDEEAQAAKARLDQVRPAPRMAPAVPQPAVQKPATPPPSAAEPSGEAGATAVEAAQAASAAASGLVVGLLISLNLLAAGVIALLLWLLLGSG